MNDRLSDDAFAQRGRRSGIVVRRSIISRRSEGQDARPLPAGIQFRDPAWRVAMFVLDLVAPVLRMAVAQSERHACVSGGRRSV
jgi:hypothetical protein